MKKLEATQGDRLFPFKEIFAGLNRQNKAIYIMDENPSSLLLSYEPSLEQQDLPAPK